MRRQTATALQTPPPTPATAPPPPLTLVKPPVHLRPRFTPIEQFIPSLRERIDQRCQRQGDADRVANYINKAPWPGWMMTATDGFTALLERTTANVEIHERLGKMFEMPKYHAILGPEFHTALRRAIEVSRPLSGQNGKRPIRLTFLSKPHEYADEPTQGHVWVEASNVSADAKNGEQSREWVPAWGITRPETIMLDGKLLEPAMGRWPLWIFYNNAMDVLILSDADDRWRMAMMPMRP